MLRGKSGEVLARQYHVYSGSDCKPIPFGDKPTSGSTAPAHSQKKGRIVNESTTQFFTVLYPLERRNDNNTNGQSGG